MIFCATVSEKKYYPILYETFTTSSNRSTLGKYLFLIILNTIFFEQIRSKDKRFEKLAHFFAISTYKINY